MRNSIVIAGVTTLGVLTTSLMAGYAFAKYRFRGRNALFAVLIATMFLPPIVTLIPLYRIVTQIGFDGRLIGVIAPNLVNAFGIFLLRQFIQGVPDELIDAARIDGAGELRILVRIVAPLVTPALAALALFAFVYYWNAYLWPLTVLSGREDGVPDRAQPRPPAQLHAVGGEHQPGDGRGGARGAAAARRVRLPAALLRALDRPQRVDG